MHLGGSGTTARRRWIEFVAGAAAVLAAVVWAGHPGAAPRAAQPTTEPALIDTRKGSPSAGSGHPATALAQAAARLNRTDQDARGLAAHALALRAAVVEGEGGAILARIPGGGPRTQLLTVWPPFFANAVVVLGRAHSAMPVVLYYNPLLDVALLVFWQKRGDGYGVVRAHALPGERLDDPDAAVTPVPEWLVAEDGPVEALARVTATRLDAFGRAHPGAAREPAGGIGTFAADAADGRAAQPRLLRNAVRLARWNSGADVWLHRTLEAIRAALSADDPASIVAAAPATDTETAQVISAMSAGFTQRLVLDIVLALNGSGRLLVGSSPDDGDVYVMVLCRLQGDACGLRRIMLVSLEDWRRVEDGGPANSGG